MRIQYDFCYLKSSMDRFIVKIPLKVLSRFLNLKSSMDRFIDFYKNLDFYVYFI